MSSHWDQFEVWVEQGSPPKWERIGAFRDIDYANAVAQNHLRQRVRVTHVHYDGETPIKSHAVMQVGATRKTEDIERPGTKKRGVFDFLKRLA